MAGCESASCLDALAMLPMRLNLLASGRFLTMLPLHMVRQRANKAWLRALSIDLSDSAGPIAAITVRNRSVGGAMKLFKQACRQTEAT
jgi:DNA-binding transcriptional LysR family regulator